MKNGNFSITYLAQLKKIKFGKFWTSKVQFLDLDLVGMFTDRNFVDNFLQVEIYLALVANI